MVHVVVSATQGRYVFCDQGVIEVRVVARALSRLPSKPVTYTKQMVSILRDWNMYESQRQVEMLVLIQLTCDPLLVRSLNKPVELALTDVFVIGVARLA